jgi:hypothetical protein
MLGRAGRRRDLHTRAEAIHQGLQADQRAAPALLADAYGTSVTAIVGVLTSLSAQIDSVHATLSKRFEQHYADAKAGKNYAGTAPITKASGKLVTGGDRVAPVGWW